MLRDGWASTVVLPLFIAGTGLTTVTNVANASKEASLNLDRAIPVQLPLLRKDLQAAQFHTSDGKRGWVLRLPGRKPLATPAYADGKLFVGGGYGSKEFYAIDAATGKIIWKTETSDDGPTAAVVEDGCVALNTESCTVIVLDEKTGALKWQEYLGDPLVTQPAIYHGQLYVAYPSGQQNHPRAPKCPYNLLCMDLKTGRHLWEVGVSAGVISAPVLDGDMVYLTCFDGSCYRIHSWTGDLQWKEQSGCTSAPLIVGSQVVLTTRQRSGKDIVEGLRRLDREKGATHDHKLLASVPAGYLKHGQAAISATNAHALDTAVGFGAGSESGEVANALGQSGNSLGVNTVVGSWAYQGSRAAFAHGEIINAQGAVIQAIRRSDARLMWRVQARGGGSTRSGHLFSPPSLGQQNLYLCGAGGQLAALGQRDGKVNMLYGFHQPVAFQPALADGSIFIGTANGLLICLKTGAHDAQGWLAWGGNAQHNGKIP